MIRDKDLGIDMVLMELHMPDMCGLDLLDDIKRISDLPVLGGWHPEGLFPYSFLTHSNYLVPILKKNKNFFTKNKKNKEKSDCLVHNVF